MGTTILGSNPSHPGGVEELLVASCSETRGSVTVGVSHFEPHVDYFNLLLTYDVVTDIQEGRGHSGSGRRKEEVKDTSELITKESKAPHDAKRARAKWRG